MGGDEGGACLRDEGSDDAEFWVEMRKRFYRRLELERDGRWF